MYSSDVRGRPRPNRTLRNASVPGGGFSPAVLHYMTVAHGTPRGGVVANWVSPSQMADGMSDSQKAGGGWPRDEPAHGSRGHVLPCGMCACLAVLKNAAQVTWLDGDKRSCLATCLSTGLLACGGFGGSSS